MLSLSPNDHLMHIDQTSWPMRSFRLTSPLLERKCKWDSSLLVCIWSPFMLFWCLPSQVISYRDLSLSVIPNRLTVGDLGSRLLIKFLKSGLSLAWTTQEWMPSSANRFERITTTTTKIIRELRQRSLDYFAIRIRYQGTSSTEKADTISLFVSPTTVLKFVFIGRGGAKLKKKWQI